MSRFFFDWIQFDLRCKSKNPSPLSIIHNQQQLHWEKVLENFKEWTFCNWLKGFHEREVEKRCVLLGLRTLWKDVCHTFLKPCHSNSDCNKKMCSLVNTFLFKPLKTGGSLFKYPHYTTNVFKGISLGGKGFFMGHGTLDGAPIGQKLSRGKKRVEIIRDWKKWP